MILTSAVDVLASAGCGRFRLEQVDDAFQAMREGEVIRSVLMFD